MKSAIPDEPKQAAQDAVSAAKDSLPEASKGLSNPFQSFFSGEAYHASLMRTCMCHLAVPVPVITSACTSFCMRLCLHVKVCAVSVAFRLGGRCDSNEIKLPRWLSMETDAGDAKNEAPEAASIPEQPKEAAEDAISAVKAATPEQPLQAAKDAVSSEKDSLPEAPKELSNPIQNFFSGIFFLLSLQVLKCYKCSTKGVHNMLLLYWWAECLSVSAFSL